MFTYIIAHKPGDPNTNAVMRYLRNHGPKGMTIIVIEQGPKPEVNRSVVRECGAHQVFLYNPNALNYGWAFNVGAKMAPTEEMVMGFGDIVVPIDQLMECYEAVQTYYAVSPFSQVVTMGDQATKNFWDHAQVSTSSRRISTPEICQDLVMFTKSGLYEIGGWDEELRGCANFYQAMTYKLDRFLDYYIMDAKGYRLSGSPSLELTDEAEERLEDLIGCWDFMSDEELIDSLKENLNGLAKNGKYRGEPRKKKHLIE
jgi:hypothetical protein